MRTRSYICHNGAFPAYPLAAERRFVNERRLWQAKVAATRFFETRRDEYKRVFTQYTTRKYHCKPSAVVFDSLQTSQRRIRNARLCECDDCYGWTDGYVIWVSRLVPMSYEELLGTLIHEELHCFCRVRGRFLGSKTDHHCMRVLGEA